MCKCYELWAIPWCKGQGRDAGSWKVYKTCSRWDYNTWDETRLNPDGLDGKSPQSRESLRVNTDTSHPSLLEMHRSLCGCFGYNRWCLYHRQIFIMYAEWTTCINSMCLMPPRDKCKHGFQIMKRLQHLGLYPTPLQCNVKITQIMIQCFMYVMWYIVLKGQSQIKVSNHTFMLLLLFSYVRCN